METKDIKGPSRLPGQKENPTKIIMDIVESQMKQVIHERGAWSQGERREPADGDISKEDLSNLFSC